MVITAWEYRTRAVARPRWSRSAARLVKPPPGDVPSEPADDESWVVPYLGAGMAAVLGVAHVGLLGTGTAVLAYAALSSSDGDAAGERVAAGIAAAAAAAVTWFLGGGVRWMMRGSEAAFTRVLWIELAVAAAGGAFAVTGDPLLPLVFLVAPAVLVLIPLAVYFRYK